MVAVASLCLPWSDPLGPCPVSEDSACARAVLAAPQGSAWGEGLAAVLPASFHGAQLGPQLLGSAPPDCDLSGAVQAASAVYPGSLGTAYANVICVAFPGPKPLQLQPGFAKGGVV